MRNFIYGAALVSIAGMAVTGMTPASANQGTGVYNGMNDSYVMTGIQEVSFTTQGGNYSRVPVWSMEPCVEEDGSGQDACVWHAPSMGDGNGGSIVYVGVGDDKDYAYINHEAARVLLAPEQAVVSPQNVVDWQTDTATDAPVEEPVQAIQRPVVEEPVKAITTPEEAGFVTGPVPPQECYAELVEKLADDEFCILIAPAQGGAFERGALYGDGRFVPAP